MRLLELLICFICSFSTFISPRGWGGHCDSFILLSLWTILGCETLLCLAICLSVIIFALFCIIKAHCGGSWKSYRKQSRREGISKTYLFTIAVILIVSFFIILIIYRCHPLGQWRTFFTRKKQPLYVIESANGKHFVYTAWNIPSADRGRAVSPFRQDMTWP